jgi:hypothetical protein
MGTLREDDAPGVADDEAKEEADVEAESADEPGGVPMLEELDEK